MRRRLTLVAVAALSVVGALLGTTASAQAATTPAPLKVDWNWVSGYLGHPNAVSPPGANDNTCKGTAAKPPVILVHGTWENQSTNWQAISPFLKNNGFCVYSFNYGGNANDVFWGYKSIADSAAQLATFVDQVRATTGAAKVDILGHSQGGMMPRYYIKFLGGYTKVRKLVALAPSNHGTTLSGIADLGAALGINQNLASIQPAAIDQTIGSPFMKKLDTCPNGPNADICAGDPVQYTVIETNGDQVVTPYTNAFLKGATNITVNDKCPLELAEHLGMTYSRNVGQLAVNALDPSIAKNVCIVSLPYLGGGN